MKYINNDFDVNKSLVDEIDGTFFYTERLKVRSMKITDLPDFYFYRSNPEVAKYGGFERYNAEQANEFIIEQVENRFLQHGEWVQFGIEKRETERLIGDCAVMLIENHKRIAKVKITISHKEQRKGYGKEALTSLLNFLFECNEVRRVTKVVDVENLASIKLIEQIGFRLEGHFIESCFSNGKWRSEFKYAILKHDWKNLNNNNKI